MQGVIIRRPQSNDLLMDTCTEDELMGGMDGAEGMQGVDVEVDRQGQMHGKQGGMGSD